MGNRRSCTVFYLLSQLSYLFSQALIIPWISSGSSSKPVCNMQHVTCNHNVPSIDFIIRWMNVNFFSRLFTRTKVSIHCLYLKRNLLLTYDCWASPESTESNFHSIHAVARLTSVVIGGHCQSKSRYQFLWLGCNARDQLCIIHTNHRLIVAVDHMDGSWFTVKC